VATQVTIVERRGEQNVPKRYLKTAEWYAADAPKAYQGAGYYISDPDSEEDDALIAVDFHFESLQWGITQSIPDGGFRIYRPVPSKHGLRIYNEEQKE
jgi:hypothetical protein